MRSVNLYPIVVNGGCFHPFLDYDKLTEIISISEASHKIITDVESTLGYLDYESLSSD